MRKQYFIAAIDPRQSICTPILVLPGKYGSILFGCAKKDGVKISSLLG